MKTKQTTIRIKIEESILPLEVVLHVVGRVRRSPDGFPPVTEQEQEAFSLFCGEKNNGKIHAFELRNESDKPIEQVWQDFEDRVLRLFNGIRNGHKVKCTVSKCGTSGLAVEFKLTVFWGAATKEIPSAKPPTKNQQDEINRLRRKVQDARSAAFAAPRPKITVESLFEHCPEGDFNWGGEPEDVGNAWNCGDSDCESGWHQSVQCIEQGREGDKTWFIVLEDNFAGDGDYQPVAGWDEREGDEVTQDILDDLWFHLHGRSIEHFAGWANYCLDVAETGEDPLNNWCFGAGPTPASAIAAAKDNLKYLRIKPGK